MPNSQILRPMVTTVQIDGTRRVNPSEYFRPTAQATSSRPASTTISQEVWVVLIMAAPLACAASLRGAHPAGGAAMRCRKRGDGDGWS